jgi:regulatory protein
MAEPRKRDAFELAVVAISSRERTVEELRGWLADREVPSEEIEEVIDRLISIGELDDERYAQRYAEDKRELRGWGPERIREALISRGVDRTLAERAAGSEDAETLAERAADLLARRNDELSDDSGRSRALAYLARRGYDYEVAYRAVRLAAARAA